MQCGLWLDGGTAKKLATAYLFAQTGGHQDPEYHCGNCQKRKLHQGRNCRKFFPDEFDPNRRGGWVPWFPIKIGDKSTRFALPEFAIKECPVSAITGESLAIVEMAANADVAHDKGGVMFGPDAAKWPAWWADALGVLSVVRRAHEKAFEKASSK